MLTNTKRTVFLLVCTILAGCTTAQAVATAESRLLTPASTFASITPTSNPLCTDEPDLPLEPDRMALLELSDLPIELESGINWMSPQIEDGLEFYISGIYAINAEIAFVFGGLKVFSGDNMFIAASFRGWG